MVLRRLILFAACLILAFSAFAETEGPNENVVAKVGNVIVSEIELQLEIQKIIPMQLSFHSGLDPTRIQEINDEALSKLIERAYKVQYAIDEEIAVDAALLEEKWQEFVKSKAQAVAQSSDELLGAVRANMYKGLLAVKAEKIVVDEKVNVQDAEVKDYFENHRDDFYREKLYAASHILIKEDPASNEQEREATLERAQKVLERAQSGEDFYDLAYYESDDRSKFVGGSLGKFHAGQTVAEFDNALAGMQPGQISGLVKTMYGYHIIKLDSVEEARQLTYEEAAPLIRKKMEKKQRDELFESWMKALQERYKLEKFID